MRAKASIAKLFRTPASGIKTNPVSNVPTTAPKVFKVSSDPTFMPSEGLFCETTRIIKGNTDPMHAAGKPKITREMPGVHQLMKNIADAAASQARSQ